MRISSRRVDGRPDEGPEHPGLGPAVLAHHRVLEHRHVGEQLHVLERAGDAQPGDLAGRAAQDRFTPEHHVAAVGCVEPGDDVEHRALARAVGTDHRHDLVFVDLQVQAVEGVEATEVLRDPGHLEQRTHEIEPPDGWGASVASASNRCFAHWSCVRSSSWSSRLRRTFGIKPCGRSNMTAISVAP